MYYLTCMRTVRVVLTKYQCTTSAAADDDDDVDDDKRFELLVIDGAKRTNQASVILQNYNCLLVGYVSHLLVNFMVNMR